MGLGQVQSWKTDQLTLFLVVPTGKKSAILISEKVILHSSYIGVQVFLFIWSGRMGSKKRCNFMCDTIRHALMILGYSARQAID